ncbi:MAG: radical SAM protein [Gemmatimonadota bacterium]|nr:radical SAM protein [Gemmatimonadota bacterium]
MSCTTSTEAASAPAVPLTALDQLWFQVSGTVCNLRCRHCFISCAPDNHAFWFMDRVQVSAALAESTALGVKEYYFTGGEPFMQPALPAMLAETLALGPATVLTNGTLFTPRRVAELARLAAASMYSLELRVSLDGVTVEANDAIRGPGTFARALDGIGRVVAAGFLPIITTVLPGDGSEAEVLLQDFRAVLGRVGYTRPRLKLLPTLRLGAEVARSGRYAPDERVTHEMLHGYDLDRLLCTRARLVTARGVYACPILLDHPSARLADALGEATRLSVTLREQACYTCWQEGAICANATAGAGA